jgi:GTP cyclohydrolase I
MSFESGAATSMALADVQSSPDSRNIAIDRVGVRGVKYPIEIRERGDGLQRTVGNFTLLVDLPEEYKGTHMSRFLEVLGDHAGALGPESIARILSGLRMRLRSQSARLEVRFTLFRSKAAPVTERVGMMAYECGFIGSSDPPKEIQMLVMCPVATLCPCSKEISSYGAHNQRGYVTVKVAVSGTLWFEDLIDMIEGSASAPLYPVLKRIDEKFVTEQAYENPRFVEDVVREVAMRFDQTDAIRSYQIEVENHESIHDHNAYAFLEREKAR